MSELLLIALGGALGAISRYLSSKGIHQLLGTDFPYGTLVVNVLGSFIVGLLMIVFIERFNINPLWRGFFIVGFLGAFTTFSSFSYETLSLFESGLLVSAGLNVLLNVILCLAAVFAGVMLGRSL